MRRTFTPSVLQRVLLCALAMLLALAPISGAAAATMDEADVDASATEAATQEESTEQPAADPTEGSDAAPADGATEDPPAGPPTEAPDEGATADGEDAAAADGDDADTDAAPADEPAAATLAEETEEATLEAAAAEEEVTAAAIDFGDAPVYGDPNARRCNLIDFRYTDGHRDYFWFCGPQGDIDQGMIPAMHVNELHISCSYVFGGGVIPGDSSHMIASWSIVKYQDGDVWKTCGEVFATPEVDIQKWIDTDKETQTINAGQDAVWTIKVTNTGGVTLTNVAVTDAQAGDCAKPSLAASLAPGQSVTYTCTSTNVTQGFTNVARVTTAQGVSDEDTAAVAVRTPDISITKSPKGQSVAYGGTATWTIVVKNTGEVPLTGVVVTDERAPDCAFTIGDLAVGAEAKNEDCTLDDVTASFRNIAVVDSNETGPKQDHGDVTVPDPALTAIWSCPTPGDGAIISGTTNRPLVSVTLNFARNGGSQTFTTSQMGDFSFSGTGVHDGKVISSADIVSSVASLSQTVTPTQAEMEACFDDNPSITIDKRPTGWNGVQPETQAVAFDGTANWTITVKNTGDVPLSNVRVSDDLAADCRRLAGDNLGTLAVDESRSYTCSLANVTAGFVNSATATGTPPPGGGGDVSATDTSPVTVNNNPSIAIDKRPVGWNGTPPETQAVAFNGTANWLITVTNNGNVPLTNVRVSDALAANCERLGANAVASLAVNATHVYTCSLANVTAGFVNSATATGTPPPGGGGDVSATDTSPVTVGTAPAPAITIVKAYTLSPLVDPQTIPQGGTATWQIRVTNTGNTVLNNVTVTDPQAPTCARNLGSLAAGASADVYACSLAGVAANMVNRADVVGTSPAGTQVTANDTAPVTVTPITQTPPPAIQLIKTVPTPECPRPGESVTYSFEIRNTGQQTLTNVTLSDPLLGGAVTLPSTTLPVGQSMTATKSYTLTAANINAGSLSNSASVSATGSSGQAVNNTGNAVMMLEPCADILLDKDGPDEAQVGEQITYTFTVTNTGNQTLTNVRLFDERLGIDGLLVNPSTLEPGQQGTATATYTVTEADGDAAEILNVAFVRARTPDDTEIDSTDDHRTIVPRVPEAPEPGISLVKDGPASAVEGESVTYRFTVTNTGDVTLTNVSITDPLLGLDRLTVRPSTLAPDEQGTATATYVITAADAEAGSVYNTAVARGRTPDGTPVRDRDDHTITVPLVPPAVPPRELPPPELPATGIGTTGFALTALLSLALGGVLLGIAGAGNLQVAMANAMVNADSPMLAMLRRWNLAPKPGGSQARRRRRR